MPKQLAKNTLVLAKPHPVRAKQLLGEIRHLIAEARERVAQAVNAGLVLLNWQIGRRIRREILKEKRADYGQEIVGTLSRQLTAEFGQGFTDDNLFRMIQFAESFPNFKIVGTLSRQLGWSHFVLLLPMNDPLQRDFYAEMCRVERWSVRTLRDKIQGMLFERTALSRKPAALARAELRQLQQSDRLSPDLVFRDPYLLDFLGLHDTYSEHDLETAILREIESFLIELGGDFAFVARQKRMVIDGKDYRLDLLFFHRGLRRPVAIDLKLGPFQAQDKGQMELYLRWLERHEQRPGEKRPIGLILCAGQSAEQVELLRLDKSGIRVAQYLTALPSQSLLKKKLLEAVRRARHQVADAITQSEKHRHA